MSHRHSGSVISTRVVLWISHVAASFSCFESAIPCYHPLKPSLGRLAYHALHAAGLESLACWMLIGWWHEESGIRDIVRTFVPIVAVGAAAVLFASIVAILFVISPTAIKRYGLCANAAPE